MTKELADLEIKCRSNYSNVKAKQNDFETVLHHSQLIIKIDPNNGKGLFRQGQALFELKKYNLAYETLKKAHQVMENDETVAELLKAAENKIKQMDQEEEKAEPSTDKSQNADPSPNSSSQTIYQAPKRSKVKLDAAAHVPKEKIEKFKGKGQENPKDGEEKKSQSSKSETKLKDDHVMIQEEKLEEKKQAKPAANDEDDKLFNKIPDVDVSQVQQS